MPSTLKKLGQFGRYRDVDGDGIPYRTVPGDGLPPYFTRGSGHNEQALYSERADDYVKNLDRLSKKFETAKTMMPKPEVDMAAEGGIGLIAYGTTHWAIVESRDQLKSERGIETSYLRLQGVSVQRGGRTTSSIATIACTSSSRIATPRCCRCCRIDLHTRSACSSFAASVITPGCRSTAGR